MAKLKIDWGKISDQIKEEESKKFYKKKEADTRFFVPDVSKDGYAEVRIRLLPSPDTDIPYVKKYNHGFQTESGQWLIENCPKTIGEKCPICEAVQPLWKDNKDLAKERAQKLSIITNILIIKDPTHPENEGKVMLWRYGIKLHEKIMDKVNPKKGSVDEPIMVFDPENGADFKLKAKRTTFNKGGKQIQTLNYDTSEFAPQSALTKEQMEIVEKGLHNLGEFIDKSDFKSYDQLLNLLEKKTGSKASIKPSQQLPAEKEPDNSSDSSPAPIDGEGEGDDNFFANLRKKAQE